MAEFRTEETRATRLDRAIRDLLAQTSEIEAAAVVSFDGLPMASALPPGMDEDRVAAMSAALLSLGERATVGLGRGELSQVFIEGETGTVFLVSADNEAVLVAVAAQGAKAGMMLYEVKRAAAAVADILRAPEPAAVAPESPAGFELPSLPSLDSTEAVAPWTYAEPAASPHATEGMAAPAGFSYGSPEGSNGSGSAWS